MLRDLDIRRSLHDVLAEEHAHEPDSLLIDELGVCQGAARIDLAVVNGSINGFEIKSEADRLHRLARQRDAYGAVLDTVTLVTCQRHLAAARLQLPRWWGLMVAARDDRGVIVLRRTRRSRPNPHVDPEALAQLLWRAEALELLAAHGLAHGMHSKTRSLLWSALARHLSRQDLSKGVRDALKQRSSWRA